MATMTEQVQAYLDKHASEDEVFAEKMRNPRKTLLRKTELVPYMQSHRPAVLLTIGAGDIDRLVPELGKL